MWPFGKRKSGAAGKQAQGTWSLLRSEYQGKPLLVRIDAGLKDLAGKPPYDHQVGVAVPFRAPDENGFCSAEEGAELGVIERTLASELTADGESVFAAVLTTGGMREFVFYTSNPQAVEAKLKALVREVQSHTVQGMIRPDEDWSVYREFT